MTEKLPLLQLSETYPVYPETVLLIVPVLPPLAIVVAGTFALHPTPQGPIEPPFHVHDAATGALAVHVGLTVVILPLLQANAIEPVYPETVFWNVSVV